MPLNCDQCAQPARVRHRGVYYCRDHWEQRKFRHGWRARSSRRRRPPEWQEGGNAFDNAVRACEG